MRRANFNSFAEQMTLPADDVTQAIHRLVDEGKACAPVCKHQVCARARRDLRRAMARERLAHGKA